MATTISEEVKAYFTANVSGLVDGVDRAKKKIAELKKSYSEKVGNVKDTILDPASLAGKGIDKLTSSMKLSAITAGAVAAGFELASNAISKLRDGAAEAKAQTDALNDSMLKLGQSNRFTSASEGSGSLLGKLGILRDADTALRAQDERLHPTGAYDNAALHAQYFANYGPLHGDEMLEQDRSNVPSQRADVAQQQRKIQKEINQALVEENRQADERLTMDQRTVQISELRVEKQRELNALKAAGGADTPENVALVNAKYDDQIKALEQARSAEDERYRVQQRSVFLQLTSLSADQQSAEAAEMRANQIDKELRSRTFITQEERRQLTLAQQQDQVAIRLAQRAELSKSPRAIIADLTAQRRREVRNEQLDRRIAATDGLINIKRDINGNIQSGTDIVTGLKRGPSGEYLQRQRGGLQTGPLRTEKLSGINDQSAGKTAIDAQRATVQAINISNAYLKNISDSFDNLAFA